MKKLLVPLLIVLLAGCASPPPPVVVSRPRPVPSKPPAKKPAPAVEIDRSYSAKGQSSRVKFIIVHYTVSNLPRSLKTLTQDTVSSHYLLTDDPVAPVIYGLVDETRQSNHAGVSSWKNYTLLNGSSVGIEIVNAGFTEGPNGRVYHPFPQAQIDKLIVLMKDIAARHQVPPENVLGHSDIAPQRKQDPGPLFPWAQLARHGLVLWPDAARVAAGRMLYEQQLPDIRWFQQKLAAHGYAIVQTGEIDEQTRVVISAFQMKYRPADFGGFPDAETAALLEAMNPTPVSAVPAAAPVQAVPAPVYRPVVPAPVAPAPVVPAPVVTPPVTPAPVVPAPVAPAPAPVVPAPVVPAPVAPAPVVPAPVVPAPVVPAPVAPAPVAPTPVVPAPVAPAPVAPAPIVPAPLPAPVEPAPVTQPPAVPAPTRP